jgi:hypothetical protein
MLLVLSMHGSGIMRLVCTDTHSAVALFWFQHTFWCDVVYQLGLEELTFQHLQLTCAFTSLESLVFVAVWSGTCCQICLLPALFV